MSHREKDWEQARRAHNKAPRRVLQVYWADLERLFGYSRRTLSTRAKRWELNLDYLPDFLEFIERCKSLESKGNNNDCT